MIASKVPTAFEAMDYTLVGERIRKYRTARGITQAQLAEASGLSDRSISSIETGKKKLMLDSLLAIAKALEVTADSLLLGNQAITSSAIRDLNFLLPKCSPSDRKFILETMEKLADRLSEDHH